MFSTTYLMSYKPEKYIHGGIRGRNNDWNIDFEKSPQHNMGNWPYFRSSLKYQNIHDMTKSFKTHIQQLLKNKYLNVQLPAIHG